MGEKVEQIDKGAKFHIFAITSTTMKKIGSKPSFNKVINILQPKYSIGLSEQLSREHISIKAKVLKDSGDTRALPSSKEYSRTWS